MLAGLGGLVGVTVGVGSAWSIGALGYADMVISWLAATIGVLFSVSLGVTFALYPAVRAAALEPIGALRAE